GVWSQIDGLELDVMPEYHGRPPVLIGAGGPRMLRVAARHADIVGLLPAPIKGSEDRDDPGDRMPQAFDRKFDVLRSAAGDRFPELELSAFAAFHPTTPLPATTHRPPARRARTEELIPQRGWDGIDVEAVWQMPTIYIGSPAQIRDDLQARRERFGLSYLVTSDHDLPALSTVIAAL